MKNPITTHQPALALYLIASVLILVMLTAFAFAANIDQSFTKVNFARNAGDACLLTCWFWLLSSRRRWLMVIPIAFIGVFSLINLWYFRFWNDILPVSCLTMTENVNGLLLNSIQGLLQWFDLIFIAPIFIYLFAAKYFKRKTESELPKHLKTGCFAVTLILFVAAQWAMTEAMRRWQNNEFLTTYTHQQFSEYRITIQPDFAAGYYGINGLTIHTARMLSMLCETANLRTQLSENKIEEVNSFIKRNNALFANSDFATNKDKNIVFIIVESLNAEVIDRKVNNKEVTPTLNGLIKSEGTISTTSMRCLIQEGCSGDGQLMYNTGVLPLTVGCTPLHIVPVTNFIPLARQLNRNIGAAVFADDANSWNQRNNFTKYGFNCISSYLEAPDLAEQNGSDAAMFHRGSQLIDSIAQPFITEFITLSMHVPFQDKGVDGYNWILEDTGLEHREANYLRMCAYFDHQLGNFIEFLKEKDIYKNTILIIASDHSQILATASGSFRSDNEIPIVFIATNTGVTKRIDRPTMQIDVFPTILQIAGMENPEFVGVGTSMLDSINRTDIKTAQQISELILRGNYFGISKN